MFEIVFLCKNMGEFYRKQLLYGDENRPFYDFFVSSNSVVCVYMCEDSIPTSTFIV